MSRKEIFSDDRVVVNHIIDYQEGEPQKEGNERYFVFATHNPKKLAEYARILGPSVKVLGVNLNIPEIQDTDPDKVLEAKAIEAWKRNGCRPVIVEDSALPISALNGMPGPFADAFTKDRGQREKICQLLNASNETDRSAAFRVGFAVFDGFQVHSVVKTVTGRIAESPRGAQPFGFDDIFIPDGQDQSVGNPRTYAEMKPEEKDALSPRRLALEELLASPFDLDKPVFVLPDPYPFQMNAIQVDELAANPTAVQHAFNLEALAGNKPNADFKVTELPNYQRIFYADGQIVRYVTNLDTPSIGLLLTKIDTAPDINGEPTRLDTYQGFEDLLFWQMGFKEIEKALAARAYEFSLFHNEEMYQYLRDMMDGKIVTPKRSNSRSRVIEKLIKAERKKEKAAKARGEEYYGDENWEVEASAAIQELGIARESADREMSRTKAAHKGLIINVNGTPTSIFALGGMPPVTGWKDVITTSALSFTRSWIPHNSIYAENYDLQLKLFHAAVDDINQLEIPKDINELVIKQIGISVGSENPEKVAAFAKEAYEQGLKAIRIYTTNPDPRTVETARLIRQACPDIFICVGPIVDIKQAKALIQSDIKVDQLLIGHGGGENCTSLEGGGVANALELIYLLSIDPAFNDVMIGLEGGTGNTIAALLGIVDTISLNRRGVAGGIETGGLFVQHTNGNVVQPYHGSASAVTQWIEAMMNPSLTGRRVNPAGDLKNVEGKPNYMEKSRSIQSIVQNLWNARMFGGRGLADQNSTSIADLRNWIAKRGHTNHREATAASNGIAKEHRRFKGHH